MTPPHKLQTLFFSGAKLPVALGNRMPGGAGQIRSGQSSLLWAARTCLICQPPARKPQTTAWNILKQIFVTPEETSWGENRALVAVNQTKIKTPSSSSVPIQYCNSREFHPLSFQDEVEQGHFSSTAFLFPNVMCMH